MNSDTKPKSAGWAKVPHHIVDAGIPDTLKLVLWYCYDKPEDWTFSVPVVARSLDKTPQCIRGYFRQFADAGVLTRSGELPNKHGLIPLFTFHPDKVTPFIKSRLKVNPETDPETDREKDHERNPATGVSDTKNNIPQPSTEKDSTEKESTKTNSNGIDGASSNKPPSTQIERNLAEEFEKFFQPAGISTPDVVPTSVNPESACDAAGGGREVPIASTAGASPVPSIQDAYGKSNAGDNDKRALGVVCGSAGAIRVPVTGSENTAAQHRNGGHHEPSANRATCTGAKSGKVGALIPSDAEWCAEKLIRDWKQRSFTPESMLRMEAEFRKRLAENDWSTCASSYLATSDVKRLKEQVEREFAEYQ